MEADGHSFIYFGKSQFFTFHWTEGLVGGSRGQKVVEEVQGELFFLGEKKENLGFWDLLQLLSFVATRLGNLEEM